MLNAGSVCGPGDVIGWCRTIAAHSEDPGVTTRTFLSAPMRDVHSLLTAWMTRAGMRVHVDAAGNLRGIYDAEAPGAPTFYIGSHLDTVPRGGAFDGVLGFVLGIALVDRLAGRRLPFTLEVVGFSEEEGVRFGVPFIGSRALAGTLDEGLLGRRDAHGSSVADAIRAFGLDPALLDEARAEHGALGYLEFHIEQGPQLEALGLPLGFVDVIAGQTRVDVVFEGRAGHAGTTPMNARKDALTAAAEWIGLVEREAGAVHGLVATVGRISVQPGAVNVIPGRAQATLDVRHASDETREAAVAKLLLLAYQVAAHRGLAVTSSPGLDQPAVSMDRSLTSMLERAVRAAGLPVHRMSSGAGHDAMILAPLMPAALLLLRSPGGISHHPDESVLEGDVAAALDVGQRLLDEIARTRRD